MSKNKETKLAKVLPPEDIRIGDHVCPLYVIDEYLTSACLQGESWRGAAKPLRVQWMPTGDATPKEVIDVCLPFVALRDAQGRRRTIDTRRWRLARVSERFAQRACKPRKGARSKPHESVPESGSDAFDN